MTNIQEILERLGPILEVNIGTYYRNKELFPLQDAQHGMQVGFRWLKLANEELGKSGVGKVLEQKGEQTRETIIKPPTLLGTTEQLSYMREQLISIVEELEDYKDETSLPSRIQYKIDRGYDKLVEALFDTETAHIHFNQLENYGRSKRG